MRTFKISKNESRYLNMKKIKLKKLKRKNALAKILLPAITGAFTFVLMVKTNVYATDQVLAPINNLKNLFIGIVGAIGAIVIVKGIMGVAEALPQNDNAGVNMGVKTIVGGVMMALVSVVLAVLGV